MLQIEHTGCWIAYWGLLISILVQEIAYRGDFHYVVGEWIVFIILCVYVLSGCIKNGLWDRHSKPTMKNNVIASLIAPPLVASQGIMGACIAYCLSCAALFVAFAITFAVCAWMKMRK